MSHTACINLPPTLEDILDVARKPLYQHGLFMTCVKNTGMPVLFCSACGAMAVSKAVKLRELICRPAMCSDLRKLRKVILPGGSEAELLHPWPLTPRAAGPSTSTSSAPQVVSRLAQLQARTFGDGLGVQGGRG